jgi:hypothetical protein
LIDSVERYLNNNDSANAVLVNGSIDPQNLMDSNSVYVNNVLAGVFVDHDTIYYDSLQRVNLMEIAYQNPIIGGDAVYRSPAILKLDVDDTRYNIDMQNRKSQDLFPVSLFIQIRIQAISQLNINLLMMKKRRLSLLI